MENTSWMETYRPFSSTTPSLSASPSVASPMRARDFSTRPHGVVEPREAYRRLIDVLFDLCAQLRVGRPGILGLEFVAVELRRIVAGRNHHRTGKFPVAHGKRHRRRRYGFVWIERLDAVRGEGPARQLRVHFRQETIVVPDDGSFRKRARIPIVSRRLRDSPDILEGKILSNDATPAIGAELNG